MSVSIFPRLLGKPIKLDFVLPGLCSNCGAAGATLRRETPLEISRFGLRLVESPGFVMELPFCKGCVPKRRGRQPVTLSGIKRKALMGKVSKIYLHCRNHDFALAFKSLNQGLISAGWLAVVDGDAYTSRSV